MRLPQEIGLTDEQQRELSRLSSGYHKKFRNASETKDHENRRFSGVVALVHIYIESLCLDARVENSRSRTKQSHGLRRKILADLKKMLGRRFTAADIVGELSRFAVVPEFATAAIQRDVQRLSWYH